MNDDSTLSSVVLPEPVPPEMTMFWRDCTAASRSVAICAVIEPNSIRSLVPSSFFENLRMVIAGPRSASGGMMALTREPSCRRASTIGTFSSMRRPSGATMRSITPRTCSWFMNRAVGQRQLAALLDVDLVVAVDHDLGDGAVGEQVLERPEAERLVEHRLDDLAAQLAVADLPAFLFEQRQDLGLDPRPQLLHPHGIARQVEVGLLDVDLVDQALVQAQLQLADHVSRSLASMSRTPEASWRVEVVRMSRRQAIDFTRDGVAGIGEHAAAGGGWPRRARRAASSGSSGANRQAAEGRRAVGAERPLVGDPIGAADHALERELQGAQQIERACGRARRRGADSSTTTQVDVGLVEHGLQRPGALGGQVDNDRVVGDASHLEDRLDQARRQEAMLQVAGHVRQHGDA